MYIVGPKTGAGRAHENNGAGLRSRAHSFEKATIGYLVSRPSIAALAHFIASVAVVVAMVS